MVPIVQRLLMTPINFPVHNVWVTCAYFLFSTGRLRFILKLALVLWFLHQISLQVVKEANGVNGCTCSEVSKELELAEASQLIYAVLEYLFTRLYWLLLRRLPLSSLWFFWHCSFHFISLFLFFNI